MSEKKQLKDEELEKVSGGDVGVKKSNWNKFVDSVCVDYNYWLYSNSNKTRSVKRAKVIWYMDTNMHDFGDDVYQELLDIKNNDSQRWEETIDWITDLGFQKIAY